MGLEPYMGLTTTTTAKLAERYAYNGSNILEYIGTAQIGSLPSQPVWAVAYLEYDGSNNLLSKKWADGGKHSQIWDNRASLVYK